MINLTQEEKDLFLQFQEHWSLERVKNMTLEEYTGIGGANRNDFTYWIENKLDKLGSIWGIGGGGSFKFGIYKRADDKKREDESTYKYNKEYAWCKKYGETPQQAFEQIKFLIVKIIECSQQNKLDEINEIDLVDIYKWKIAFHYQNINDMGIVCIFSKKVLQNIAKGENLGENLSTAQIYQKLLGDKTYTLEMMINEKSMPLWEKYGSQNNKEKEKMETSNQTNTKKVSNKSQIPLNQILYGPPGTGKTYQTIDRALEILLEYGEIESIPESREEKKKKFDEYKANGQIAFITFHQSFSYEEFVEGIKPDIKNSENMIYELQDGIFKVICEKARTNYQEYQESNKESKDRQQVDTQELFQAYALSLKQDVDEGKKLDFCDSSKMKICSINLKNNGEVKSISIGTNIESAPQSLTQEIVLRDYQDFRNGVIKDYKDIKPTYESKSPWHGNAIYYFELYKKLKEFEQKEFKPQIITKEQAKLKPYILIIDEINRGNISKILGELITLIEPSKRIGENEALEVTLPYSQESFGVPNNLYIIGTMNTADRSIALLDTALRRRFEFIEMMPDCEALKNIWLVNKKGEEDSSIEEWNSEESQVLYQILKFINHRIEFLLDREHTIGHAFFFEKAKFYENERCFWYELSLKDLQAVFAKKIIPLLQEYFYEDYAKIDAVLNGNGMIKSQTMQDLGISLNNDFVDSEKKFYQITDSSEWELWQFVKIYNEKKAKELEESLKKNSKIEPTIKENDEN